VATLVLASLAPSARAEPSSAVEHEPIPADPADDLALGVRVDGELSAAIMTSSGLAVAPDPSEPVSSDPSAPTPFSSRDQRFVPDTDTRRPGALPYSDPFTPSTAPWKRLVAFDSVLGDSSLSVDNRELSSVPLSESARTDGSDERFFGDLVVDLRPNEVTRIPSVGPGARVVHARLGVGADEIPFELLRDGAENWFVRSSANGRARLVLELAIARAAFGGPFGNVQLDPRYLRWGSALPRALARDVEMVAARIGLPKSTPRETVVALVDYFRSFEESDEPPSPERSVYLSLALSKKGVCRHRAYAFMVTATGLGIRSRAVMNEAHAWVEVLDGQQWRRVDLGGAGTLLDESPPSTGPRYSPPPDPFRWPPGSTRGDDLGRTALGGAASGRGPGAHSHGSLASSAHAGTSGGAKASAASRASSLLVLEATESQALRGDAVHVRGTFTAAGEPCAHAVVILSVKDPHGDSSFDLGSLATDDRGLYQGSVVIPKDVLVGDYELVAASAGDARCGPARSGER
jgi:transglutaminase-like putative cysteine protease